MGRVFTASICLAFAALTPSAEACARHIIVLYDSSGLVLDQPERIRRLNGHLADLLLEGSRSMQLAAGDTLDGNALSASALDEPLFRSGDCLSLYTFGMEQAVLTQRLPLERAALQFWPAFARSLIHPAVPGSLRPASVEDARAYLQRNLPRPETARRYYFTLSLYSLPALLASLRADVFAARTLVVYAGGVYAAPDGMGTLDPTVLRLHAARWADVPAEARQSLADHFAIDYQLFRMRVGGDEGLKLQVLEVRPAERPRLAFVGGTAALSERTLGQFELSLPVLRWEATPDRAPYFEVLSSGLVLRGRTNRTIELPARIPWKRALPHLESGQRLEFTSSAVADLGREISVRSRLRVHYRAPGPYGLWLPLLIETPEITCAVAMLPTPPNWPLRAFLALLAAVGIGYVWYGCLRRPGVEALGVEKQPRHMAADMVGSSEPFSVDDARNEYARVLWVDGGANQSGWSLRNNKARANIRTLWLRGHLMPGECDPELGAARLRLVIDGRPGDYQPEEPFEIELKSLERVSLSVWISLGDEQGRVPEPRFPQVWRGRFQIRLEDCRGHLLPIDGGFQIEENPGPLWVAVDPGTCGSCVALGSGPDGVELVPLQPNAGGEARVIMQSFVYICQDSAQAQRERALTIDKNSHTLRFLCGESAAPYAGEIERCFHSPKRLIGYEEKRAVLFDGRPVPVQGQDAVSMIVRFLLDRAQAVNSTPAPGRKINKLVVAVPNMFTPAKIQEMKTACLGGPIRRVEHIYEAEATLMYYLAKAGELLGAEGLERRADSRRGDGEYVLSFDFGGASLNLTYARIRQAEAEGRIQVHVLHRLGYALGGNSLDWAVGNILWEVARRAAQNLPSPLEDPRRAKFNSIADRQAWIEKRARFRARCEEVKIECSKRWEHQRGVRWDALTGTDWAGAVRSQEDWFSADQIVEHSRMQEIYRIISEAIEGLKDLCRSRDKWHGVDTLIYSGRSVQVPLVKETARATVAEPGDGAARLQELDLGEDRKTCVARGAAFWCSQREVIELSRTETFAHYGVARLDGVFERHFVSLIRAGEAFSEGLCTGSISNQRFQFNGGELRLYQVMGPDPQKTIASRDRKHSHSVLCEMSIEEIKRSPIKELRLSVREDDTFSVEVLCGGTRQKHTGGLKIRDLLEDQDDSARWLVVPPGTSAATGAAR
jgi:molecular chaperone DnaK (HSP70)